MAQPLLEGGVLSGSYDAAEVIQLTAKVARLEQQNRQLDEALRLERIRTQSVESAAKDLRNLLFPLFRSLRLVFGELDQMGVVETVPLGGAPQFDPKWAAWMDKFGRDKCPARVIQAILDHGPLSRSQLRQAIKAGWSTLDEATARLKNLQLIEKSGDRWNLKG
jgi:hypothetical protein